MIDILERKINAALTYRFFKNSIIKPFQKNSLIHCFYRRLFKKNGLNICYNGWIKRDYNEKLKNILIAIESPEVIRYKNWIDPGMKFYAEISFANFYNLDNYYCCRDLYCNNDNFVHVDLSNVNPVKHHLVSMIYSHYRYLPGHKFRHEVAQAVEKQIDLFGSGTGKYLKRKIDSLWSYRFQVVIENGKYPEYVSEKFFDCLKTKTIPIYWGGDEGIKKMGFDLNGIISFNSLEELKWILSDLVNVEFYESRIQSVEYNFKRLKELRNENKLRNYLQSVLLYYHQTENSYHKLFHKNKLNLAMD